MKRIAVQIKLNKLSRCPHSEMVGKRGVRFGRGLFGGFVHKLLCQRWISEGAAAELKVWREEQGTQLRYSQ
jgi:hypothetical protein